MKFPIFWGIPLALAACAQAGELPASRALAPASEPTTQIRPQPTVALLSGYTARPVKGPADWRALNDRQAPQNKGKN